MKNTITAMLFFVSITVMAQMSLDSIAKDSLKKPLITHHFSDKELSLIDSLVLEIRYKSPLLDVHKDAIEVAESKESTGKALEETLEEKNAITVLKERLQHLDTTTPFSIAYNPILENFINSYLKYRKRYYPKLMAKAAYYFPMFEKYLAQYNIPLEMKYLAIVESALNPRARSRVGARGLWQFMYATGKQYTLHVSSYVDERQDPLKATVAACAYLSDLHAIFGDWDLALAAYNSGPGNVSKAIKRSGGYKNYWNLRQYLPKETADYVPAFYATMYLFEYANEYGILPDTPSIHHFATDTIQLKRTVSFDQIVEIAGVKKEVLQFLNPAYKLEIIPYIKGKNYSVTLPKRATVSFLAKEKELYALADRADAKREKPLPKYLELSKRIRYKVKNGDYLGKIAEKYGIRVSKIKKWNRLTSNNLKIGQRLTIFPKRI